MLIRLWYRALALMPTQRRRALRVTRYQRTPESLLREAIIHVGINRGALETARLLREYWLDVKEGPEGIAMDQMYAERMLDGRISN